MKLAVTAGLALCLGAIAARSPLAQMSLPEEAPPDGATLFTNQCGTCHTLDPSPEPRMGPPLRHVFGRKAGSAPGFKYSDGFAKADWAWDDAHLDAWLTNPQAMIPNSIMLYRQNDPEKRKLIIVWLKEQQ